MTKNEPSRTEMDEYWNGAGGQKWVKNLDRLETLLEPVGKHLIASLPLENVIE